MTACFILTNTDVPLRFQSFTLMPGIVSLWQSGETFIVDGRSRRNDAPNNAMWCAARTITSTGKTNRGMVVSQ